MDMVKMGTAYKIVGGLFLCLTIFDFKFSFLS